MQAKRNGELTSSRNLLIAVGAVLLVGLLLDRKSWAPKGSTGAKR